jgi:cytochrome b
MPTESKPSSGQPRHSALRVWDLPTRVFHWLLVGLILAAWLTSEFGWIEWHAWIGQGALALVIYRLFWGLVGSQTAQFWNFIRGPAAVRAYAKGLVAGKVPPSVGHNPLGALMILALLGLVALQATLGLFANDDIYFEGPLRHLVSKDLSDLFTGLHELVFNLILAAVALHVTAALFYWVVKRAMITGTKPWPEPHPRLRFTPAVLAVPALAAAAALVWAAVTYL